MINRLGKKKKCSGRKNSGSTSNRRIKTLRTASERRLWVAMERTKHSWRLRSSLHQPVMKRLRHLHQSPREE